MGKSNYSEGCMHLVNACQALEPFSSAAVILPQTLCERILANEKEAALFEFTSAGQGMVCARLAQIEKQD